MLGRTLFLCGVVVGLSGCAAAGVPKDVVLKRTSFALGVEPADVTIDNVEYSFQRTQYRATDKSGKSFNCYIGSMFRSLLVSDAMCSEKGKPAKSPFSAYGY